jgi:hypothetical protein
MSITGINPENPIVAYGYGTVSFDVISVEINQKNAPFAVFYVQLFILFQFITIYDDHHHIGTCMKKIKVSELGRQCRT